ncbi:hypothetical protein TNCV_3054861 [Trichonephila clavipes]|nr:hypothetical protein TNCV_3054861 [Trichonephila clavipes]
MVPNVVGYRKDMKVCADIPRNTGQDHQTSNFVMVDFLDIGGQVVCLWISSYGSMARISVTLETLDPVVFGELRCFSIPVTPRYNVQMTIFSGRRGSWTTLLRLFLDGSGVRTRPTKFIVAWARGTPVVGLESTIQDQKNTSNAKGVVKNGNIPDAPNLMEADTKQNDISDKHKKDITPLRLGGASKTVPDAPVTRESEVTCDD